MAIEIQKNKIEKNKRPIGIKYPLTSNSTSFFQQNFDTTEQLKDNVFLFFSTAKGERIMNTNYGTRLYSLVFEPTELSTDAYSNMISSEFRDFLPYAEYKDTEFFVDDSNDNLVSIKIYWSIKGDISLQETFIEF